MKAVRIHQYGSIDNAVLEEIPVPTIGLDEVLVQVEAASINPLDVKLISGAMKDYFPLTMPYTVGTDLSGTVVEAGLLAARWKQGDRVIARLEPGSSLNKHRGGAFAEFVVVPAQLLTTAPTKLDLATSAGLPTAAGTAWQALFETAHLKSGQTVLIHAGAGGVGSFAVQLAKYIDAHVISTASAANADLVHSLGADQVIDYRTEDFSVALHDVDVVLDTIGGETLSKSYQVIKPGGFLVSIVMPPDQKQAEAHGVIATFIGHRSHSARLDLISGLCDAGQLRVIVDRTFHLSEVQQGLAHSASGRAHGKILLRSAE
ncbi:NADP-dependent oxidoreductase [Leptolyngbya sp. NIES-2104]|uniref:NADP-dependent oxidoreductase n=1 Tax=Leptolyngbya sp. NIES-2104 TaxID=1552121 RepID=UPI0006EC6D3A|nr:NADP-dependent oxidoreductase [Leptolyngbya sp. NIES-2104]GAP96874.1 zinc-containing alcohol dehydrogenase, NADPH:quinone reductase [Leptolyngbya sp. NIES-2104]